MLKNNLYKNKFLSFAVYGALNTLITYMLYLFFLKILHYQWAYLATYTIGILLAFFINTTLVFKVQITIKKLISYPAIYIFQYVIGAVCFFLIVEILNVSENLALLGVIFISIPISFILNKVFLSGWKNRN